MDTQVRVSLKSFYYNLISHGCQVYLNDEINKLLIVKLICTNCTENWKTGRQECFLCGTENFHVYTCIDCNHKISITAANKTTCPQCQSRGTLKQMCINPECVTNTSENLKEKVTSSGGVFQGNGGFSIRQMSCKQCGSTENKYASFECVVVPSKDDLTTPNSVFVEREAADKAANSYWINVNNELKQFYNIDDLIVLMLQLQEH